MHRSGTSSSPLVLALLQPAVYEHPVDKLQLIETHISWVILTGDYAYKIKKPVDFGFLDFSTLDQRKHFCEEELRLNQRLAANIYLDVVVITGSIEHPKINGVGDVIEYAVRMRQFPQSAQMDRMLARGELAGVHMDAMARIVAEFHGQIPVADSTVPYGAPQQVYQTLLNTIITLRQHLTEHNSAQLVDDLERWCQRSFEQLQDVLAARKAEGYVRECHGDMHLRNLAWVDDKPLAFDCIEFNPELMWNDVISEIAFLIMDLDDRGQAALAARFLNGYLERSGDYGGLRVLRFYLVYRALVRAMVDAIRLGQQGITASERVEVEQEAHAYLLLAQGYTQGRRPCLILTRGISGTGKTTLSQPLLERLGAIRIRSDVERKRMHGLRAEQQGTADYAQGIYSAESTQLTYARLAELATGILQAAYSVIVDATFAQAEQRAMFYALAQKLGVVCVVLEFTASAATLRKRIEARKGDASDADLDILQQQLSHWQPLATAEESFSIHINTERDLDLDGLLDEIHRRTTAPC